MSRRELVIIGMSLNIKKNKLEKKLELEQITQEIEESFSERFNENEAIHHVVYAKYRYDDLIQININIMKPVELDEWTNIVGECCKKLRNINIVTCK